MKTIAQQLNIEEFPFVIKDKNGKVIYTENSNGFNGNLRYYENSNGFWCKYELYENGSERYYENSSGEIRDNRVKEMTKEEAEKKFKIKIK
jgi:hypothetical protein